MSDEPPNVPEGPTPTEFLLYPSASGEVRIEVRLQDETVWLPQKALAELFGVTVATVSRHFKNIFESLELQEISVVTNYVTTASDGKTYPTRFYNLDAIIAVGYRVNSYEATQFRIWATQTLREYVIKGFVLNDTQLKQGTGAFGTDYFEELLERIREIRASERRFYQKVTDLYALSADYDKGAPTTRQFFASVQNKLHWAITGETAAELIHRSADATQPAMGLRTWKHAPAGKVLKSDVSVAKNYLTQEHLQELNRLVSAYLDLAENRARRRKLMKMADWSDFLHRFLELSDYEVLSDKGRVSAAKAKLKAEAEFESFRVQQDAEYRSDFDAVIEQAKRLGESGGEQGENDG